MVTLASTPVPSSPTRVPLPTPGYGSICSAPPLPTDPCPVCPRLAAEFEPWRQAAYWQSMHQRAVAREKLLQAEVDHLKAQLRLREQQLFGRKTETQTASPETINSPNLTPKKRRGQQLGRPGPSRRDYSHLPEVVEDRYLAPEQQQCSCCGQPFEPFPGTEDSEVLEIDVRAYRRVIRRHRYRPSCTCQSHPGIITAPQAAKVIPKSILGVSIWTEVLLDKFLFYRPTYRLLAEWQTRELDLSLGTITDGLQRLAPLFEPVYQKLIDHNQTQNFWHGDETRWMVFATIEGKVGHRWFLWVFHSREAVVFVLSSGRAHDVPESHLGTIQEGILVVDRYSAYKAMAAVKEGRIILAFCWAHVRRDFLEVARSWPSEEGWALGWLARIGQLYEANDARRKMLEDKEDKPAEFAAKDMVVRQQVVQMASQLATELATADLPLPRRKVLTSLEEHWSGLTVFVDHPEVPMDNNTAERAERGPVVLRKNSYGSGAVWAGKMAAMVLSVFQTLSLWNINPRVWLTAYLEACATAGGKAPPDLDGFLPWRMEEQKRKLWSLEKPPERQDTS